MKKLVLSLFIYNVLIISAFSQTIRYVKPDATGDGSSWANASGNIQSMIDHSTAGDQVWLAGGTYLLTATVEMKDGVSVYGGFEGIELTIADRPLSDLDTSGVVESWEFLYATILDGQNARRVLNQATNFTVETVCDGVTITNGRITAGSGAGAYIRTNGKVSNSIIKKNTAAGTASLSGGGISNIGGTVIRCVVSNNTISIGGSSSSYSTTGGGVYSTGIIDSCIIKKNSISNLSNSYAEGGGIYNTGTISNSIIYGNSTAAGNSVISSRSNGGGIYNANRGTIRYCIVNENRTSGGGEINNGGGIYNEGGTITHCTVSGNQADNRSFSYTSAINAYGGGIYNSTTSGTLISYCIINENTALASNNYGISYARGGAIYSAGAATIMHCTVNGNTASNTSTGSSVSAYSYGGGLYFTNTTTGRVSDCLIQDNKTLIENVIDGRGGAIYNGNVIRCTVKDNHSGDGGGLYYSIASHCLVLNNSAVNHGGGGYDGKSTNCTFVGNTAGSRGGGVYYSTHTNTLAVNAIFWKNDAPTWAQIGMPAGSSTPANITYSAVQNGYTGTGNINITQEDGSWLGTPVFADAATGNYQLHPCSPCVNIGTNSALSVADTTDLLGNSRVYGLTVDLGAYELGSPAGTVPPTPVITQNGLTLTSGSVTGNQWYLDNQAVEGATTQTYQCTQGGEYHVVVTDGADCSAKSLPVIIALEPVIRYVKLNGTGDGSSWENASGDIQRMIDYSDVGDQVWLAGGTYLLDATLIMRNGVNVTGGFAGTEQMITERQKNDLDGNDTIEPWEFTYATVLDGQNARQVFNQAADFTVETVWDGVMITNGKNGGSGAGAYIRSNGVLINSIIKSNRSIGGGSANGGGIYNGGGTVAYCFIGQNTISLPSSDALGGGIYNTGTVSYCIVSGNTASTSAGNAFARGGGIYNRGTVSYCTVSDNTILRSNNSNGGGIYNNGGTITHCTVSGNTVFHLSAASGGGIYNAATDNSKVTYCTINDNHAITSGSSSSSAAYGGGIYNAGAALITHCTVSGNTASNSPTSSVTTYNSYGGGIYCANTTTGKVIDCMIQDNKTLKSDAIDGYGGAIYQGNVTRCTIKGNFSGDGGGLYYSAASHCLLLNNSATNHGGGGYNGKSTNCTFIANTAGERGGGVYYSTNTNTFAVNCIFWRNNAPTWTQIGIPAGSNNPANITYSAVQDGFIGTGNMNITQEDGSWLGTPVFADAATGNYQLYSCSPCVNTGTNGALSAADTTDLLGNFRIYGVTIDVGAYELQSPAGTTPPTPVITQNGLTLTSGSVTGNQWYLDSQAIEGATTQTYQCTQNGEYHVVVTDGSECSAKSQSVIITSLPVTRYVKRDGTGDGSSWANASDDMQTMIDYSNAGDQVWIAGGTYLLNATLEMKDGVHVYGGFEGTETDTALRQRSDLDTNGVIEPWEFSYATILDGQDARRVLNQAANFTVETVCDGVTVINGRITTGSGAGAYIRTNGKLINSVIKNNRATGNASLYGGGICNIGGMVTHCMISHNTVSASGTSSSYTANGGGIYTTGMMAYCIVSGNMTSAPGNANGGGVYNTGTISHCRVIGNTTSTTGTSSSVASNGGGIYCTNTTTSVVNDCIVQDNKTIKSNVSDGFGGGIYQGMVIRSTIRNNSAGEGGGLYRSHARHCLILNNEAIDHGGGGYEGVHVNCTFTGNRATLRGGGIYYNTLTGNNAVNCIFWNNNAPVWPQIARPIDEYTPANVSYSAIQDGYAGNGNITIDEHGAYLGSLLFADTVGNNYRLHPCSPAVNAGSNDALSASDTTDLSGQLRMYGAIVDMGAYELQSAPGNSPTIPVITQNGFELISGSITNNQWYFNNRAIDGATAQTYLCTQNGEYAVVVSNEDECSARSVPVIMTAIPAPVIRYVKSEASGFGDGSSWTNASDNIQNMIEYSETGQQVWIAGGTYQLGASLRMKNGVSVFGGFEGAELDTANRQRADLDANGEIEPWEFIHATVLDGQNTVRVLNQPGSFAVETVFDGVTITRGYLNGVNLNGGAGAYIRSKGRLNNCIIRENTAKTSGTIGGGGVYNYQGVITNCLIRENTVSASSEYGSDNVNGGGIYNTGAVVNCTITRNTASGVNDNSNGGGVYNTGTISYCSINENTVFNTEAIGITNSHAKANGGGVYNSGGSISHCTINGNSVLNNVDRTSSSSSSSCSSNGGGIYNTSGNYSKVIHCVVSDNTVLTSGTTTIFSAYGGGIYNAGAAVISHCTIVGNTTSNSTATTSANSSGGGIYCINTTTCFINDCIVEDNTTLKNEVPDGIGGGIHQGKISRCIIENNSSGDGGGLYQSAASHCLVKNNTAVNNGGGGFSGTSINCTFAGNTAGSKGGGIYYGSLSGTKAVNAIFWQNDAPMWAQIGTPAGSNMANISYSAVQDGYTGSGNIAIDEEGAHLGTPVFEDATAENYQLYPCSPCVNTGDNSVLTAADTTGLDGQPRIFGSIVDMGAIELQASAGTYPAKPVIAQNGLILLSSSPAGNQWYLNNRAIEGATEQAYQCTQDGAYAVVVTDDKDCSSKSDPVTIATSFTIRYVKPEATGTGDGSSWENASANIQDMIDYSDIGEQVWIAGGTYPLDATLIMKNGINVYGGFEGTETNILDRPKNDVDENGTIESWEFTHVTILDGQNAIQVLHQPGTFAQETVWDGVTITKGRMNTTAGGVHIRTNGHLLNCIIRGNSVIATTTSISGGGVYNSGGKVSYCAISGNRLSLTNSVTGDNLIANGGGIYNTGTLSYCSITGNTVSGNSSTSNGGGVYNTGVISHCTIRNNTASNSFSVRTANANGGGVYTSGGKIIHSVISENSAQSSANFVHFYSSACYSNGGGIYATSDYGALISYCTVKDNTAFNSGTTTSSNTFGGGIYNAGATITHSTISGNTTSNSTSNTSLNSSGGGIYCTNTTTCVILDCIIQENKTLKNNILNGYGGGVYSGKISRCKIKENNAGDGGGIYQGIISHCLLQNNRAANNGGGAYNGTTTNCTFLYNTASERGGGIYYTSSNGKAVNCILWQNDAIVGPQIGLPAGSSNVVDLTYSAVQGGYPGAGNISISENNEDNGPLFINLQTQNFQLQENSPCINAGNNVALSAADTTDLAGDLRIFDANVDMGAYERQGADPSAYTISGQITYLGSPLVGVTLQCTGSSPGHTNAEGEYNLPVYRDAAVEIIPDLPGYQFMPPSYTCTSMTSDLEVNFTASAIVPVTHIDNLPAGAVVGIPLILTGTVIPANATNQTIIWSAGNDEATITGNIFIAKKVGPITVTATIVDGLFEDVNYTQEFTITVEMFCGGDGSWSAPYQICSHSQLKAFADYVNAGNSMATQNKYYIVTNDIDLGSYDNWIPIGTPTYPFYGNFNGNGKVIRNLTITNAADYCGLFGYIIYGNVFNLGLEDCNIMGGNSVGALVGRNSGAGISDCYATGFISGSGEYVGGLVGDNRLTSITNCYFAGDVHGADYVGGLAGSNNYTVSNNYTIGNVSATGDYVGGLVGWNQSGTIRNCIAANTAVTTTSNSTFINRIAGLEGTSQKNYALQTMTVQNNEGHVVINDESDAAGTGRPLDTLKSLPFYSTQSNWYGSATAWSIADPSGIWKICDNEDLPFLRWQGFGCDDFIPVTTIADLPDAATAGMPLMLTGTVNPDNATFRTIIWSVHDAGTTGAIISGNTLYTTGCGTVVATATIFNGMGIGVDYTQNFTVIVQPIAVTDILNVPGTALAGVPLALTGRVLPANASNQTIVWSVADAGTTGATITGNRLYTTGIGTVEITATIVNGIDIGHDYVQDFSIVVNPVAVTNITDVPDNAIATLPFTLTGTVYPSNATFQDIVWSLSDAGTTGATITGNILYTIGEGTVVLNATITDGTMLGHAYIQNFTITVSKAQLAGTVTITGIAAFDETLTADPVLSSIPTLADLGALTYQWKRGNDNIGADSPNYTLEQADIGNTITVTIMAVHCAGSVTSPATAEVSKATQIAPEAPVPANKTATSITLTEIENCEYRMNNGSWQNSVTFDGLEPNTSYSFTARRKETATHQPSPESLPTPVTTDKAILDGVVTITGNTVFGETLTVNTSGLTSTPASPLGTLIYQWKRGSADIGANSPNYTLEQADIGNTITVTVMAIHCNGSVTSPATAEVSKATQIAPAAPVLATKTTTSITLTEIENCEYRMNNGIWQNSATFDELEPNTSYNFTARRKETATHQLSPESSPTLITTDKAMLEGVVTITGNTVFGEMLTANTSGLTSTPVSPLGTLVYQWKRGSANIGANSPDYTLVQADIGNTITVTVTATHCAGSVTSDQTSVILKATQTAPDAPTLLSADVSTITLNVILGCEYRVDNGVWQGSVIFDDLPPNTTFGFQARRMETATHLASPESSVTYISTEPSGIHDNLPGNFSIYPNPTMGELRIESQEFDITSVEFFDAYGRNVGVNIQIRSENPEKEIVLDISHLPAGAYFVKIFTSKGVVVKKVVKG